MEVGITGVAKGLKVPCLFMIAEVSIRCQKNPEVGIRRIPAYTPQYTTDYNRQRTRRSLTCHTAMSQSSGGQTGEWALVQEEQMGPLPTP